MESDTSVAVMHELVHDYINRHLSDTAVHNLMAGTISHYKGTTWGDGVVVTGTDAPRAATETIASFTEGQIEARMRAQAMISTIMDNFNSGNLDQAEAVGLIGEVRNKLIPLLNARGSTDAHGTLTTGLSSELKQEAADLFLGGIWYQRFEDLPEVVSAFQVLSQPPTSDGAGKP